MLLATALLAFLCHQPTLITLMYAGVHYEVMLLSDMRWYTFMD
jgi:hypothetical protein